MVLKGGARLFMHAFTGSTLRACQKVCNRRVACIVPLCFHAHYRSSDYSLPHAVIYNVRHLLRCVVLLPDAVLPARHYNSVLLLHDPLRFLAGALTSNSSFTRVVGAEGSSSDCAVTFTIWQAAVPLVSSGCLFAGSGYLMTAAAGQCL